MAANVPELIEVLAPEKISFLIKENPAICKLELNSDANKPGKLDFNIF